MVNVKVKVNITNLCFSGGSNDIVDANYSREVLYTFMILSRGTGSSMVALFMGPAEQQ